MRTLLSKPLAVDGAAAVDSVVSTLEAYDLMREDFDSIMELTAWSSSVNPLEKIDSKVTYDTCCHCLAAPFCRCSWFFLFQA